MPARSAGLATRPFFATSVHRSLGPSPFCSTSEPRRQPERGAVLHEEGQRHQRHRRLADAGLSPSFSVGT